MRPSHLMLVVLLFISAIAQADPATKPSTMPTETVSTADFDVALPRGWRSLAAESAEDRMVYQSADNNIRLTASVMRDYAPPDPKEMKGDLAKISEIRRQVEAESSKLTPIQTENKDDVWSSNWRGTDSGTARQTATLVRLTKSKVFFFYIEALDTPTATVDELIKQVFASVKTK